MSVDHDSFMWLFENILDVILPYDCLSCGVEGRLVCRGCWSQLDLMLHKAKQNGANIYSTTAYRGLALELVHAMKITCQRQACEVIAQAMHETMVVLPPTAVITSVPTATARVRERGFDHAACIAREFARLRRLRYRSTLFRFGAAKQAGESRHQRTKQMRGVYTAKKNMTGELLLVIDDVTTTGVTLNEVAQVLYAADAARVDALVFARAQYK